MKKRLKRIENKHPRSAALILSLLLLAGSVVSCAPGGSEGGGSRQETVITTEADTDTQASMEAETETETEKETEPMTNAVTEMTTEPETETFPETEPETEPETDPPRLSLGVDVDPYVPDKPAEVSNVKAMWLSQFDMQKVYSANGKQRAEGDYRARIRQVLENVASCGFNTVFVQVRPYADSFVPSEYYPPSKYVVGSYGAEFAYDPFAILIEEAKEMELSVHAWINPMRGMSDAEIKQVGGEYPIRQWYDDGELRGKYIVRVGDQWYLNPAYAEVRKLIADGARELVRSYDIDGVHMDDYFYPTQEESFDAAAYAQYKAEGGRKSLAVFRKLSLSDLVSDIYRAVKSEDPSALFGISPTGVYTTVVGKQYADADRWCANPGFIDYILPQVYFGFEHATCAFDKVCLTWQKLIKTDYVTLLIGVSFGKALSKVDNYAGSGKDEWAKHNDVLKRGVEYALALDGCQGMSVFCYQYFWDPVTSTPVAATKAERDNFLSVFFGASW